MSLYSEQSSWKIQEIKVLARVFLNPFLDFQDTFERGIFFLQNDFQLF
jgi:hypothetical protein